MNHYLLCLSLVLGLSCKQSLEKINTEKPILLSDNLATDLYSPKTAPYQINLQIEHLNKNRYNLVVNMLLNDGAYYVSPYAKKDYKGKFTIIIANNDKLKVDSFLIESPISVAKYDSSPFDWVKENTTYKQELFVQSKDDFNIDGLIQFTIEPRCTLEKIPFIISQKDGEIKIMLLDKC